MTQGLVGPRGDLSARLIRAKRAPLSWRLKNALRWPYLKGWLSAHLIAPFANWWGVTTIMGELSIRVKRIDGWVDYGVVSYRVVTDAGVAFLVDDWDANGQDISTLLYHGAGTGTTAESASQTALVTESTTALNPNNTRATGTGSQPSANIYRSVGTLTFDADAAITEHGLFSQAATGGGTLWDRSVFAAINVVGANGDSIQFTYSMTATAGN